MIDEQTTVLSLCKLRSLIFAAQGFAYYQDELKRNIFRIEDPVPCIMNHPPRLKKSEIPSYLSNEGLMFVFL